MKLTPLDLSIPADAIRKDFEKLKNDTSNVVTQAMKYIDDIYHKTCQMTRVYRLTVEWQLTRGGKKSQESFFSCEENAKDALVEYAQYFAKKEANKYFTISKEGNVVPLLPCVKQKYDSNIGEFDVGWMNGILRLAKQAGYKDKTHFYIEFSIENINLDVGGMSYLHDE